MIGCIGVGIDIGGTTIKAARVGIDGAMSQPSRRKTPTHRRDDIIALIVDMIEEQVEEVEAGFDIVVGVGTPGYGSEDGYIIGGAHNLPGWYDFNLVHELSRKLPYPVFINNDASMAAFGEYAKYYAESVQNMAYLGFGTGVGGGIVIHGKLYSGARGLGTELGHIVVDPDGMPCACGRRGCLQTWASRKGLATAAREMITREDSRTQFARDFLAAGRDLEPEEIFVYVEQGDPLARELFAAMCDSIARACDTITAILAPEVIVLGGGIMNAGSFILDSVRERFARYCMPDFLPHVSLEAARCGENSGIIGAGLYAISRSSEERLRPH